MDFIYQDYALEPLGQLCIDLANSVNELARSGRCLLYTSPSPRDRG